MNPNRFKQILTFNSDGIITYVMSSSFRIHYNHGFQKALALSNHNPNNLQIIILKIPSSDKQDDFTFNKGIQGYQGFLSKFTNNVYYIDNLSDFFYSLLKKSRHVIKDRAYSTNQLIVEKTIEQHLDKNFISMTLVESNVLQPVCYNKTDKNSTISNIEQYLDLDDSKAPTFLYEQEAKDILQHFIQYSLALYNPRNASSNSILTKLSSLLEDGYISPIDIYQKVLQQNSDTGKTFITDFLLKRESTIREDYHNKND